MKCLFGSRRTSQIAPHVNLLVCMMTKRDILRTILVVIISLTSSVTDDPEKME